MMQSAIKKQHGAVLAFCLVMLLLLTITGTRMIQQNKQQLEIANSARLLTQEFANTEGGLQEAEFELENHPAHQDPTSTPTEYVDIYDEKHLCTPIVDDFKQQIMIAGTTLVDKTLKSGTILKSQIIESSCSDKEGEIVQKCTSYDYKSTTLTCFPIDKGEDGEVCSDKISVTYDSVATFKAIAALFSASDNYCYQHYDPVWEDDDYYNTHGTYFIKPPRCPVVTYKIRTVSTSPNGTQRELITGKQIKCATSGI